MNTLETYKSVNWNTNDLSSCENAIRMLWNKGCSVGELIELNFGDLDVWGIIEEFIET